MKQPPEAILDWAASIVTPTGSVAGVEQLRTHSGPWMLRVVDGDATTDVVLKCGRADEWRGSYVCEAAALRLAAQQDVPAPKLLGSQLDASGDEPVALLLERMPGTTEIPTDGSAERHRALGRAAGMLHRIALEPSDELPRRLRHTEWTNFSLWRRWGSRYRAAASESARDDVLRGFVAESPNWSMDAARDELSGQNGESTPLLDAADERLRAHPTPDAPTVFVHGDLWQGNTMWDGDRFVGLIDWETAGAGHPGVDLGCMRWDATMLFGGSVEDEILAGWEDATGRAAHDVAYWDLVSVLNYPTQMGRLVSSMVEQGRSDLDAQTLTSRRDAYVESKLDALNR